MNYGSDNTIAVADGSGASFRPGDRVVIGVGTEATYAVVTRVEATTLTLRPWTWRDRLRAALRHAWLVARCWFSRLRGGR